MSYGYEEPDDQKTERETGQKECPGVCQLEELQQRVTELEREKKDQDQLFE